MCLIALAVDAHPRYALVVAANRDEYFDRPALAASWWPDRPEVHGGRDLRRDGAWMLVSRGGRFAAVTNVRAGLEARSMPRSRGELPLLALDGRVDEIRASAAQFDGFNLVAGQVRPRPHFWWMSNRGASDNDGDGDRERRSDGDRYSDRERRSDSDEGGAPSAATGALHGGDIAPGIWAVSNGHVEQPWPKVVSLKSALDAALAGSPSALEGALLAALSSTEIPAADALPDTGIGIERERLLAPAFVRTALYGTRTSSVLSVERSGLVRVVERTWPHAELRHVAAYSERRTEFTLRH